MASIPVIDFADFGLNVKTGDGISDEALKALGNEVKRVLITFGFFYLKNHGVDETLNKRFYESITRILWATRRNKAEVWYECWGQSMAGLGSGHEALSPERPADLKESFNYFVPAYKDNSMPSVANFEVLTVKLYEECTRLCYRFLEVLSIGLGLSREYMCDAHKLIGKDGNPTTLRSLYYPAIPAEENYNSGAIRCGEHTDYGTFTFLFQDEHGGLDVKVPGSGYIPAKPMPGALFVNVGSLLQRWTSDSLIATEHRVLIPEDESERRSARQSVAFFVGSDDEFVVKCLDGSDKYDAIRTIDYLNYRFDNSYTYY